MDNPLHPLRLTIVLEHLQWPSWPPQLTWLCALPRHCFHRTQEAPSLHVHGAATPLGVALRAPSLVPNTFRELRCRLRRKCACLTFLKAKSILGSVSTNASSLGRE